MVQGQDYMVNVAKHPNQAPIIFAEWPKMRACIVTMEYNTFSICQFGPLFFNRIV